MCPNCSSSDNTYDLSDELYRCQRCGYEWEGDDEEDEEFVDVPPDTSAPSVPPFQPTSFSSLADQQLNAYTQAFRRAGRPHARIEVDPIVQPPTQAEIEGGQVIPQELPAGFRWYGDTPPRNAQQAHVTIDERYVAWDGPASGSRATYNDRIAALKAWAAAGGVKVQAYRNRDNTIHENADGTGWSAYTTQPYMFAVFTPRRWEYNYGREADVFGRELPTCRCGEQHPLFSGRCEITNLPLDCPDCGRRGSEPQWEAVTSRWYCENCCNSCEDCRVNISNSLSYCTDCRVIECCTNCHRIRYSSPGEPSSLTNGLCNTCHERLCSECGTVSRHPLAWSTAEERYLCRNCHRVSLGDTTEETDDEDGDTAGIPTIPGRENIRMCGIELEGDQGTHNGGHLAADLYRAGLAQHNTMQGYHHGGGSFIHVEADSSVDWEMVIGPLNPADAAQMKAVNSAMRLVRQGIKQGRYKLSLRCGLHIHVGAEKFGLGQAYNLNTLFSYVEDVMFRLAAAKWPLHRSMTGSPYCQPVKKPGSKIAFGREVGEDSANRDSRRVALNFANYFQRMLGNCRCGAVRFDAWEDCTCDLGKCTFEFRLFNSTANPRKLHAYMALAQALVAKAGGMAEIENPEDLYPAQAFLPKPFKGMTEDEQVQVAAEWQPRLRWLFTELPLTDDERESILYCVKNSELAVLGDDVLAELLALSNTTEEVPA